MDTKYLAPYGYSTKCAYIIYGPFLKSSLLSLSLLLFELPDSPLSGSLKKCPISLSLKRNSSE